MAPTPEMKELITAMYIQQVFEAVLLAIIILLISYLIRLWISVRRMRMIRRKRPTVVIVMKNIPYKVQGNGDGESEEGDKFIGGRKITTYRVQFGR